MVGVLFDVAVFSRSVFVMICCLIRRRNDSDQDREEYAADR
jgi:hypothetical protein